MRFRKALTLLMLAMGLALALPAWAQQKPFSQVQVLALLAGQVPSHRVAMLVNKRGLDFEPRQDYVDEVRICGGDDELITALKSAKVAKLLTVDPASQARQRVLTPACSMAAQTSSTWDNRRPVGTTCAPLWASPMANSRPIPEVPPITTATRPERSK